MMTGKGGESLFAPDSGRTRQPLGANPVPVVREEQ